MIPVEDSRTRRRILRLLEASSGIDHLALDGMKPAERPVKVPDLHATICHALEIDLNKEVITAQGRPMRLVRKEASPIRELFA